MQPHRCSINRGGIARNCHILLFVVLVLQEKHSKPFHPIIICFLLIFLILRIGAVLVVVLAVVGDGLGLIVLVSGIGSLIGAR